MTIFHASRIRSLTLAASALALLAISPVRAQDVLVVEDEDDSHQNIIVTATVRQGGSQDIQHFRSVSLDGSFLPATRSLTVEGLLGEHDLSLPALAPCRQTFCLTGLAMPAALHLRPDDTHFVGLGFASALDSDELRREPISLIAVVDRSGSMDGEPIEHAKAGLHAILGKLRKGDRMGIVIFGNEAEVWLPVTDYSGNRDKIASAIDGIEINGGTAMEVGLEKGFEVAVSELPRSRGKTRVMLFTDENPNIGDTSPEGFMGQARKASDRGIGLTTIGLGVQFDAELATTVSSVRGGNLFFADTGDSAKALFDREFHNMVNQVAQDIEIAMTPPPGYKITGVFGVPDELMSETGEGTIAIRIASAFLSSNGGGIYVTLGKDKARAHLPAAQLDAQAPLLTASLAYVESRTGQAAQDRITVPAVSGTAHPNLRAAHALVDEYVTLVAALDAYHVGGDKKQAFHLLDGLSARLSDASLPGMAGERKLVSSLRERAAYVAGYAGEAPKSLRPLALKGEWDVVGQTGLEDIARGDRVEINAEGEFITYRKRGEDVHQSVRVNENQIHIDEARLTLNYWIKGDRLTMASSDGLAELRLRRASEE